LQGRKFALSIAFASYGLIAMNDKADETQLLNSASMISSIAAMMVINRWEYDRRSLKCIYKYVRKMQD
jgi:type IV secretory pathway component VirB8